MKTCLIVDGSRVIRKVCRQIMEALGFMCWEAENGQLALESCQGQLPDLILVEWALPVMNGLDFMKAVRQLPGGDHSQVIFCTGENTLDRIREALAAGVQEYIMKPFDADIIRSKLDQMGLLDS